MNLKKINMMVEKILCEKDSSSSDESVIQKLQAFLGEKERKDDEVHELADELGINAHELEGMIYGIAYRALNGMHLKHGDDPDEDFDAQELKMGVSVEKEHVDDPAVAKKIAKAHLAEIPDYYTRLKKMEKEAGVADESMKKRYGMSEKIRKPNGKAQRSQKLMFRR